MARNITVILGAHDFLEPEKSQQVRGVLKYHKHPEYNPITYENDIMLLQARTSEGTEGLGGHQGLGRACPGCQLFPKAAPARGAGGWEGSGKEPWAGLEPRVALTAACRAC